MARWGPPHHIELEKRFMILRLLREVNGRLQTSISIAVSEQIVDEGKSGRRKTGSNVHTDYWHGSSDALLEQGGLYNSFIAAVRDFTFP